MHGYVIDHSETSSFLPGCNISSLYGGYWRWLTRFFDSRTLLLKLRYGLIWVRQLLFNVSSVPKVLIQDCHCYIIAPATFKTQVYLRVSVTRFSLSWSSWKNSVLGQLVIKPTMFFLITSRPFPLSFVTSRLFAGGLKQWQNFILCRNTPGKLGA